jgi:hypothetical protein
VQQQQQVVTPDVREPALPRGRDTFEVLDKPVHTTPIARIASATGVPYETRTSTWRSLETISSGMRLVLRIVILLRLGSHPSGWTTPKEADHCWRLEA